MYLQKTTLDIFNDKESPLTSFILIAYSKKSQVIKYRRQRGFHIPQFGTFLKATYWILRRDKRNSVYAVLDQVVH